jgi:amidase
LPPPRHARLADYRVLVLDTHPLLATSRVVRDALARLADELERQGVHVARETPVLPDLALHARTFSTLLPAFLGADLPRQAYEGIRVAADKIPADDLSLKATSTRGWVLSHRDWVSADRVRHGLAARWRALFNDFDVVICPIMPTVAFAHDRSDPRQRTIDVDGTPQPYLDQTVWPGLATLTGQPATAVPIARSEGLPIGVQVIGPYLEDRTTIAFAALIEREFGGFVAPPGYED